MKKFFATLVLLLVFVATACGLNPGGKPKGISITTLVLPNATQSTFYSTQLAATGGVAPYTWTATTTLPTGLNLASNGVVSGTPSVYGPFSFGVRVKDSRSKFASATLRISINQAASSPVSIVSSTLNNATQFTSYTATLIAAGGTAPYTWTNTSALPNGLSLASNGNITGTPTIFTLPSNGPWTFTVQVTDSAAHSTTGTIYITINAAISVTSTTMPAATQGSAYSASLTATGGQSPYTWTAQSSLPPGLSLASNGTISGTPTTTGSFSFSVTATDSEMSPVASASTPVSLSVNSSVSSTNINLNGSNVIFDTGSTEVGELSTPIALNITNNLGTTYQWRSTAFVTQAFPFVYDPTVPYGASYSACYNGHVYASLAYNNKGNQPDISPSYWADEGACQYATVAYDGDARARQYGDTCNPSFQSANQWTWNPWSFAAGSQCGLYAYLQPHTTGAVSGHIYLLNTNGTIMSTITLTGTGTAVPQNQVAALPSGITGSAGAYSGTVYDTSYPTPSCSVTVNSSTALASALAAASCGQTICIQAGSALSTNIVLPKINSCTTQTKLVSSAVASLTAYRVSPSDASNMAKITGDGNVGPTLSVAKGAQYWTVAGLEITSSNPLGFLVANAQDTYNSVSDLPNHIIIDRNYIHSEGLTGGFGVAVNGQYIAVTNNYIYTQGVTETQGVNITSGSGPYKVDNNYITAVGEIFMIGGGDGVVVGAVPADIEFQLNYLTRPLTWNQFCNPSCTGGAVYDGVSRQVKNLFELKKGTRVLVNANIMENNWVAAQDGSGVLFEPADQSGSDLTAQVRDITFTNNIVRNTSNWFNSISTSYAYASRVSKHWYLYNNLAYNIGGTQFAPAGTNSYFIENMAANRTSWFFRWQTNLTPMFDVTIAHNTLMSDNVSGFYFANDQNGLAVGGAYITNNLFTHSYYGMYLYGGNNGHSDADFLVYLNPNNLTRNLFSGGSVSASNWSSVGWTYNATEFSFAGTSSVGFVNPSTNDYRLCTGSGTPAGSCTGASAYLTAGSDGKQYGADVTAINTATATVINGHP